MSWPWMEDYRLLSIMSGVVAASCGLLGKLGLDSNKTDHLGLDTVPELALRCLLLIMTLVLNSAMITIYTKALSLANVAAEASLLNTASNMLFTAILSYFMFSEQLSFQWIVGAVLVLIGMTVLLHEESDETHFKNL